jgi:hypothetical protein
MSCLREDDATITLSSPGDRALQQHSVSVEVDLLFEREGVPELPSHIFIRDLIERAIGASPKFGDEFLTGFRILGQSDLEALEGDIVADPKRLFEIWAFLGRACRVESEGWSRHE